jgi:hypothetical protein
MLDLDTRVGMIKGEKKRLREKLDRLNVKEDKALQILWHYNVYMGSVKGAKVGGKWEVPEGAVAPFIINASYTGYADDGDGEGESRLCMFRYLFLLRKSMSTPDGTTLVEDFGSYPLTEALEFLLDYVPLSAKREIQLPT